MGKPKRLSSRRRRHKLKAHDSGHDRVGGMRSLPKASRYNRGDPFRKPGDWEVKNPCACDPKPQPFPGLPAVFYRNGNPHCRKCERRVID